MIILIQPLSALAKRIVLLGPPTLPNPIPRAEHCDEKLASQLAPCVGGSELLMTAQEFNDARMLLYATIPTFPAELPAWDENGVTTNGFEPLMASIVKGDTDVDPLSVARAANGVVSSSDSSPAMVTELTLGPAEGFPMHLLTFLYLGREARAGGRPCIIDSDCASREYECQEGTCVDGAAACRLYDVIYVAPFSDPIAPLWTLDECGGGTGEGVDYNVWSLWMRWGIGCAKGADCPAGSSCENICSYSTYESCAEGLVCVPDDVVFTTTARDPIASRLLGDFSDYFPSPQPRDAAGLRFSVTSHAILIGVNPNPNPYLLAFGALDYASVAAVLGDGVAVTPCPSGIDMSLFPQSDYYSCDYATAYKDLLESVQARPQSVQCTPAMVGLPRSSKVLLR